MSYYRLHCVFTIGLSMLADFFSSQSLSFLDFSTGDDDDSSVVISIDLFAASMLTQASFKEEEGVGVESSLEEALSALNDMLNPCSSCELDPDAPDTTSLSTFALLYV